MSREESLQARRAGAEEGLGALAAVLAATLLYFFAALEEGADGAGERAGERASALAGALILGALGCFLCLELERWGRAEGADARSRAGEEVWAAVLALCAAIVRWRSSFCASAKGGQPSMGERVP